MSDDVDIKGLSLFLSSSLFFFLHTRIQHMRVRHATYSRIALCRTIAKIVTICRLVDGDVFAGMERTLYLSLADNEVPSIPRHILSHMSLLMTLDLSRNRISRIDSDDFKVKIARGSVLDPRLRFVRSRVRANREREKEKSHEVAADVDAPQRTRPATCRKWICCSLGLEFSRFRSPAKRNSRRHAARQSEGAVSKPSNRRSYHRQTRMMDARERKRSFLFSRRKLASLSRAHRSSFQLLFRSLRKKETENLKEDATHDCVCDLHNDLIIFPLF